MDFFKIIMITLICSSALFAFSKKTKAIDKNDFATISELDNNCFIELNKKIETILNIKGVKLSKTLFYDKSHLYLTNSIDGYVNANKIFLLHLKDNSCNISLVNSLNIVLRTEELKECICQKGDKK